MFIFKGQKQSSLDPNEISMIVMSGQGHHLSLISKSIQIPIKCYLVFPKFRNGFNRFNWSWLK